MNGYTDKHNKENKVTTTKTVDDIIDNDEYCPIPLEVIPNYMGVNLRNVNSVTWEKQEDGQLISLKINFIPRKDNV